MLSPKNIHTDKNFSQELGELKENLLKMGAKVQAMISQSLEALIKRNSHLAEQVLAADEEVNQLELSIDEQCIRVLALHHPSAVDLRFVAVAMKISTDLERIGDLAVNICEQILHLNQWQPLKPYVDLPLMATKTQAMVQGALEALIERGVQKAKQICEADDEVDLLEETIHQDVIEKMEENPAGIRQGIALLSIARHLERMADHATNVAESVYFLVKGTDIRSGDRES